VWAVVWLAVMVVKMAGDKVCCCILLLQLELYFFHLGVGNALYYLVEYLIQIIITHTLSETSLSWNWWCFII
jgi:hypothetical protein